MWITLRDLAQVMRSRRFWETTIRLAVLISFGLAILLVAFTALLALLPIALVGGRVLHLYVQRRLRQARRQYPPPDRVIDGEYTVVDR
jgi:hypothetical protein